jgi:hypothetical protein
MSALAPATADGTKKNYPQILGKAKVKEFVIGKIFGDFFILIIKRKDLRRDLRKEKFLGCLLLLFSLYLIHHGFKRIVE